jgi:medium-chain acyl-[acyl-carrier-protein] hydrolase
MTAEWFSRSKSAGPTRLRLLCFPYAGGSASVFRGWERHLPAGVQVLAAQLPGRAGRWREAPLTNLNTVVEALLGPVTPYLDEPFAFFGHSMGALVSLQLARRIRDDLGSEPRQLFVASCNPPLPDRPMPTLATLGDDDLRKQLSNLGLADEVLAEEELMEVLLPLVRADLGVADGYVDRDGEELGCPVTAFHGQRDPMVTGEDMALWSRITQGRFVLRTVPGAHLFDDQGWQAVLTAVSDDLEASLTLLPRITDRKRSPL